MPRLTQWYLRSALLYLVLSLSVGFVLAGRTILGLPPSLVRFQPVFFHLFVVGWLTQLIFGVVYWMFPKFSRENPYRSHKLAWTTFWLLNIGLLLRAFSEPTL
ncbi:MAG: cbb3-type cytochrome c oxidase subunit I, partial [Anaerolineales bacterium]